MRQIKAEDIILKVSEMCIDANYNASSELLRSLKNAKANETSKLGVSVLDQIILNDEIAIKDQVPMCQDTGMVVAFVEIGQDVQVVGNLDDAINEGVRKGYKEGYLRNSVVRHPLDRVNTSDNTPAAIHHKIVPGETLTITIATKGAGSENQSRMVMLKPSDGEQGVKDFILETVKMAGGKACPPIILGVGIGGNFEVCTQIAKEALMRSMEDTSPDPIAARLEKELLEAVNELNVGPMGFGGKTTALAVKVNTFPCHIAALPVAVNIQCHASRHVSHTF